MKKIIPALALLLISACLLSTASYAWFSMNTTVAATGMQVTAKSEGGIVIGAYTYSGSTWSAPASTAFKAEVDAAFPGSTGTPAVLQTAELVPTSTTTTTTWYHATSNDVNSYAATSAYASVAESALTNGVATDGTQYYLYNKFQIKSLEDSGSATSITKNLYVSAISVTGNEDSTVLNNSLRVAVRVNGTATYFFAPMYTTTPSAALFQYGIAGDATSAARNDYNYTTASPKKLVIGTTPKLSIATSIGTSTPTEIEIFVYYEGEDENCKSVNAVDIDDLNVKVSFSTSNS